jgi:hypothetical protein
VVRAEGQLLLHPLEGLQVSLESEPMLAEAHPAEVHQQEAIQEEVQLLPQLILEEVPQLGALLQGHPQEVRHQDLPLEVQRLVHQLEGQLLAHQQEVQHLVHLQEVQHLGLPLEVQLLVHQQEVQHLVHQQEVQLLDLPLGARHRALQPEVVVPQEEEPPLVPQLGVVVLPVEVVAVPPQEEEPLQVEALQLDVEQLVAVVAEVPLEEEELAEQQVFNQTKIPSSSPRRSRHLSGNVLFSLRTPLQSFGTTLKSLKLIKVSLRIYSRQRKLLSPVRVAKSQNQLVPV